MSTRYEDEGWGLELPAGWQAKKDDDAALFAAEDGAGLLQIRSFQSDGREIEDDDLKDLAKHHTEGGAQLFRVHYGSFSGFYVHYQAEENLWYEWWLRSGGLALHATYHCAVADKSQEEAVIAAILGSLSLQGAR